jgi:aryl-alcohol dehydrogenase
MRTMAAVMHERSSTFTVEPIEIDDPRDDEVLVRIAAVGICHTDLAARDGHVPAPLPAVFGHEGAGVVERVGQAVTKVRPGDHVVCTWSFCGACPACRRGRYAYCENFFLHNFTGLRTDGSTYLRDAAGPVHGSFFSQSSFARHAIARERNVVKVPASAPLELLGPLGCGVQAGAGAVFNALRPEAGTSIAVFGAGTVGLSAVMASVLCGCTTIIAVDTRPARLEMARKLGATHTVDAAEGDAVARILDITHGGADFSLECVGNPKVLRAAVDVLPRLGVCGLLGVVPPKTEITLDMEFLMNGRMVRGILEGDAVPDLFIPGLIALHGQRKFPFSELVTFYRFEEINTAVADMEQGRVVKPVLRM